ncbi:unnamed protein product [Cylindrotheca closterium]|uniref:Uncharacterized protein n=1 Tax=Cylindrotheca closterium TaxID=2856 RepID=A0AAD2FKX3_9STRA|nr:unnamed protein product [Cylindrotheca closterium]
MSVESVNSEIVELNVELKVCLKALNNYDKDEFFIDHPVYQHLDATDHGARLEFLRKEKEQKEEDLRKANKFMRASDLYLLKAVPPSTRPPRSPILSRKPSKVPPSTGKDRPNATTPKDSPSSNEGKIEGLKHASDDKNTTMQSSLLCGAHEIVVRNY